MNTERMKTDPALYADMETYLRSGEWQIAYKSPDALWLKWNLGVFHAIAAFDPDEARRILAQIPLDDAVILRGFEDVWKLAYARGFTGCNPCRQAVYDKTTPVPVCTDLVIRHPDECDFKKVAESYHLGTDEELKEDFASPDFLGGYENGELAGYIGVHSEGSMGMLYVFEPYRRKGYAEALYGTLINNQLKKGRVPFAQIFADNERSLRLQGKMGLRISDGLIYWMWRETPEDNV